MNIEEKMLTAFQKLDLSTKAIEIKDRLCKDFVLDREEDATEVICYKLGVNSAILAIIEELIIND